ncbi:MAG: hypothetical protein ACI82F_003637, partial [Planctomycetota bacterium]
REVKREVRRVMPMQALMLKSIRIEGVIIGGGGATSTDQP